MYLVVTDWIPVPDLVDNRGFTFFSNYFSQVSVEEGCIYY